jgi:cyclase
MRAALVVDFFPPGDYIGGMKKTTTFITLFGILCIGFYATLAAQAGPAMPEPKLEKITDVLYMITGPGGNITVYKDVNGLVVVDTQYDKSAEKTLQLIKSIADLPVKTVINTHYYGDHTGGNAIIGKGAVIMAHANCAASMAAALKPGQTPESAGVPTIVNDKGATLKLAAETVELLYKGHGHTAGDLIVVFPKQHVVSTGDILFNGRPPYIDVKDGADTANWVTIIRSLCAAYPTYTFIPGHGPLASAKEFLQFADYLQYLREQVQAAIKAGQTKEQATASIAFDRFPGVKDQGEFLTKKRNVEWVYDELTKTK